MRVLRICSVFEAPPAAMRGRGVSLDPIGGMQQHTAALTRALDERGVTQYVATAVRHRARRRERIGEVGTVTRHGVPVPWLRQLYAIPAARRALELSGSVDLVHAHQGEDLAVLPIASAVARAAGIPLVVTLHTSLAHTLAVASLRDGVHRTFGGAIESALLPHAAAVITLTARTAALVRGSLKDGSRVQVIPSGIEPERFAHAGRDPLPWLPRRRLLYVGRLHEAKGVDVLLRAFALSRTPDLQLVLVGDGPARGSLESLAERLHVAERVTFRGFVPPSDIPAMLRHADALVLPSRYEELGTVLLEAMYAGTPVIASRTGGIPSVIDDGVTGLLVPPGAGYELAQTIDRLLGDAELRGRLALAAGARAQDFCWPALAAQVLRVYQQVLGGSSPAVPSPAPPPDHMTVDPAVPVPESV